jgi:uncharacterized damage-inducible protein DinB
METNASQAHGPLSQKEEFLESFQREHQTTLRVLRAYPPDRLDLQPHPKSNTARDLARIFVMEMGLAEKALTTGFDWSNPPSGPPPLPDTLDGIVDAFDQSHRRVVELVRATPDERLYDTVQFMVAPKTLGDIPRMHFLWMLLCDQIHHRGQFSVYLRMADGKVPSIYGPTADEPWT